MNQWEKEELEAERQWKISRIESQLARIGCEALEFMPQEERVRLVHPKEAGAQRISYPHPIGIDNLHLMLDYLPTGASFEEVQKLTTMFSAGWSNGRNELLLEQQEEIKKSLDGPNVDEQVQDVRPDIAR